jgi:soluble cytochrome b562
VEKFYNLGYIDDEGVKESLLDQLYAAKKKLEAGQVKVAKNILNAFTLFVEAQFGKHITVEAATVLLEDAQYVMDSLQTEKSSSSPKMASYGHVSPKWIATITRSVKSITPSSFKSAFPL